MAESATSSLPSEIVSAPGADATTSPATYPPCAGSCLANATASLPCEETDSACLCLHASTVQDSVTSCLNLANSCTPDEIPTAADYYNQICKSLGLATSENQASAAAGPIVTASGAPSPVPTRSAAPTSSTTAEASSDAPLSVPAIAGIAAGGAFVIVCIVISLIFWYIRRKSSSSANPVVTVESPDPANPANRLRKTMSLRQSALFEPDSEGGWAEKLSRVQTLTDNEHELKQMGAENERKKSLPGTPISPADTLTNNSFTFESEPQPTLPTLPPPAKRSQNPFKSPPSSQHSQRQYPSNAPVNTNLNRSNRPPSITFLPSKSIFEASVTSASQPASRRISIAERSPAVTEFSDQASIYSATNTRTASMVSALSNDGTYSSGLNSSTRNNFTTSEVEVAHASTLIMQRSRPTTFEATQAPPQYTSRVSISLGKTRSSTNTNTNSSTHDLAAPAPSKSRMKPYPLTISTTQANAAPNNPFANPGADSSPNSNAFSSTLAPDSASIYTPTSTNHYSTALNTPTLHPRIALNPLAQNPSPVTPTMKFTFRPTSSMLGTPVSSTHGGERYSNGNGNGNGNDDDGDSSTGMNYQVVKSTYNSHDDLPSTLTTSTTNSDAHAHAHANATTLSLSQRRRSSTLPLHLPPSQSHISDTTHMSNTSNSTMPTATKSPRSPRSPRQMSLFPHPTTTSSNTSSPRSPTFPIQRTSQLSLTPVATQTQTRTRNRAQIQKHAQAQADTSAQAEAQHSQASDDKTVSASFGKFDFELASPQLASPKSMEGFRASFIDSLDFSFDRKD